MAHEFLKGINWIADPTGATPLGATRFVSKSGNDVDAGTPDLPKLTIAAAISTIGAGHWTIIVGTGEYAENNIALNSKSITLEGDGNCILKGDGTNAGVKFGSGTGYHELVNFTLTNYLVPLSLTSGIKMRDGSVYNCIINGGSISNLTALFANSFIYENKFINCSISIPDSGDVTKKIVFKKNLWINCSFSSFEKEQLNMNSDLFYNCQITSSEVTIGTYFNTCLFFGTDFTINAVLYADMETAKAALAWAGSAIESDPLFLGNPTSRFEFLVERTSPVINRGVNGDNIGGLRTGNVQNEASTEFGVSPQLNTNTSWVSSELQVTSGTVGRRESTSIDLGQVFNSPIVTINALLDFLNHTPDAENTMVNPNHLIFEADWAGNDGVFNGVWEKFRFEIPMQIDTNGLYSGEIGFVGAGLVDIQMRFIKVAIVPRNDYNVA